MQRCVTPVEGTTLLASGLRQRYSALNEGKERLFDLMSGNGKFVIIQRGLLPMRKVEGQNPKKLMQIEDMVWLLGMSGVALGCWLMSARKHLPASSMDFVPGQRQWLEEQQECGERPSR